MDWIQLCFQSLPEKILNIRKRLRINIESGKMWSYGQYEDYAVTAIFKTSESF